MRTPFGVFTIIAAMLLIDWYVFVHIRSLQGGSAARTRIIIQAGYWTISFLAVIGLLLFIFTKSDFLGKTVRIYLFAVIATFFLSKLVAGVFFLLDDLVRGFQWILYKTGLNAQRHLSSGEGVISRSTFLRWTGIAAGSVLFVSLLYGFGNKYKYRVKRIRLSFPNLPNSFKGMKILQFSDVHSGSFTDKHAVERGVQMILKEKADLVFFTGDLINNIATEMADYRDVFEKIKVPMGVYSILGNHDYGDYVQWPIDGVSKEENLEHLCRIQKDMGWNLLRNGHVILEKGQDKIAIIGVENWSAIARFPKYGDLSLAYAGTEEYPFKILLTHDPSHWDAQVRPDYPDIDLTLSGHTHGMQFGVKIPGFKWSPIQYVYKEWDGLYEEGKQKLYVNPGYGFLGYPGRVGILPEITVIELV